MKGYTKNGKFRPIKDHKKNGVTRKSRDAKDKGFTSSLGLLITPPARSTKTLLAEIKSDLSFREKLLTANEKLKEEIKADPLGEFARGQRAEFTENAKDVQELTKEIKKTFNQIPKEDREAIDRDLINELRILR